MAGGTVFWDVDTQVDFMLPSGALAVPGAERLRPNLARLTAGARAAGVTIVHTADDHDPHDPEIAADPDFVATFPPHCLRGTPGAERLPETAARPGAADVPPDGIGVDPKALAGASEIVLRKNRFDAFSNPLTAPLLRALAPDRVVVYGVALEVCDRYAVEGMLAQGGTFEIVVVEDAVAALDPVAGAGLVDQWRKQGVRVATTEQVLREMGQPGR
ncbi:MAG TPA: isochorismatase family cysteine hydrolase [Acidimicrobiia bacterium]|nr:isochorismatase family cysteine hydrolase [Acidimicrobiia bacterium]